MEGRTKFNYGMKNYILTMKDLKYMLEIVDSEIICEIMKKLLLKMINQENI